QLSRGLSLQHFGGHLQKDRVQPRSEDHTSELQSLTNLVCRLLLEKKNTHYPTLQTGHRDSRVPLWYRHHLSRAASTAGTVESSKSVTPFVGFFLLLFFFLIERPPPNLPLFPPPAPSQT